MSELGIIGQMYEDRRTKKRGKLVERDDKYKTLLMESEDGKSFNISFGGFKSNWRSIETEEPMLEEIPEEKVVEEKPTKKSHKKYKERQVSDGLEEATLRILDYVKSFNSDKVSSSLVPNKRRLSVKINGTRVVVLTHMTRADNLQVSLVEPLFLTIKNKKYAQDTKYSPNWSSSAKYTFYVDRDQLDTVLEDLRTPIVNIMCGMIKEEE